MDGRDLAPLRRPRWQLAPNGVHLRCGYCKQAPIELHMAYHDGKAMTSRSCRCGRQWFDGGRLVSLAQILALLPKGLKLTVPGRSG